MVHMIQDWSFLQIKFKNKKTHLVRVFLFLNFVVVRIRILLLGIQGFQELFQVQSVLSLPDFLEWDSLLV